MKKQIIHFNNFNLVRADKNCNVPLISDKEKEKYIKKFKQNNWHNGELSTADNYDFRDDKIYYGKSNFYDFLICHEIKQNISPIISLNAIIEVGDNIILIKRPNNVSSYAGWWDFPAGMVYFKDNSLKERLYNRIMDDTKIKKHELDIKKRIAPAITLDGMALNFFYVLKYKKSKTELESFFKDNFKEDRPIILKKSKINEFLNNNPVVFSEILDKEFISHIE